MGIQCAISTPQAEPFKNQHDMPGTSQSRRVSLVVPGVHWGWRGCFMNPTSSMFSVSDSFFEVVWDQEFDGMRASGPRLYGYERLVMELTGPHFIAVRMRTAIR